MLLSSQSPETSSSSVETLKDVFDEIEDDDNLIGGQYAIQCTETNCRKWRQIPKDQFSQVLPTDFKCIDNIWGATDCSCSTPQLTLDFASENIAATNDNNVNFLGV